MTRRVPGLALLAVISIAGTSRRQGSVTVSGPNDEPLTSVTPSFVVQASGFAPSEHPVTLRLEIGRTPQLDQPIVDTTVAGDAATIVLQRPLPEGAPLFWRAVAYTAGRDSTRSAVSGPHTPATWLTLVSPNNPRGTAFETHTPKFIWSSAAIETPPGRWSYDIEIATAVGGRVGARAVALRDTTFTPATPLETNTSFRWAVTARLTRGDTVRRLSTATFIVLEPGRPLATLLLQNFPNPFPTAAAGVTCIWFDLHDASAVRLEVLDLRGNLVRTIVPSTAVPSPLAAGRYGRGAVGPSGEGSGCDARYSWDGTAGTGRAVPPGVYLLRLSADGGVFTRKMLLQPH
ncbi:MAG: hypothetical protein ABJD07_13945 [Gemmatimonadaceae bacterium]